MAKLIKLNKKIFKGIFPLKYKITNVLIFKYFSFLLNIEHILKNVGAIVIYSSKKTSTMELDGSGFPNSKYLLLCLQTLKGLEQIIGK